MVGICEVADRQGRISAPDGLGFPDDKQGVKYRATLLAEQIATVSVGLRD